MRGPLKRLLKEMGIVLADMSVELEKLSREKYEILVAGIELGYLSKDDVSYICNPATTDGDATRRLTYKRRARA